MDEHLNPPRPKGLTGFLKRTGESTTEFFRRAVPTGGSSIMVGGLIGSYSVAKEIINRGIRGEPVSIWHGVDFLFAFTIAACYAHNLWKSDPNAKPK